VARPRRRLVVIEPRGRPSFYVRTVAAAIAMGGAMAAGAVLLLATGHQPVEAFQTILQAGFETQQGWVQTLLSATPLIFTAVAAAVAFRMQIWNIGGEGQFYFGAIASSGTALWLGPKAPAVVAVTLSLAAGTIAGAAWAGLAAIPKAYLGTDVVVSTLMLNFIALNFMNYLIFGSVSFWRSKTNSTLPAGREIPQTAQLPEVWHRLNLGFVIALAVALLFWWLLRSSTWGFRVRVIGDSLGAAKYAGIRVARNVAAVLIVSGAVAGLGGAVQVTGTTVSLEPNALSTGLGYTGIIVAAVAGRNPLAILPVAVFIAGLSNATIPLQSLGVPSQLVTLLQGLTLLFAAGSEFFLRQRIRFALVKADNIKQPVAESS
jgi:general nucleoside transport system permease protein